MEDFEFSVDISDGDWEKFFHECEECNLLSPALAGVDDSGLSDMDHSRSPWAKSTQSVHPAEHPSGLDHTAAGLPLDNTMATGHYGGLSSILSGSEEDIHLRSVNMFFERMTGGMQSKEEQRDDAKQKSSTEGFASEQLVPGTSSAYDSCILAQPERQFCRSVNQETTQWDVTPQLKSANQENTLIYACSQSSLETVTKAKRRNDVNPEERQIKAQDWSPSASFKRKRRKKRRLNFEPAERKLCFKRSDSDEEQYTFKQEEKVLNAPISLQAGTLNICHHPPLCGNKDLQLNPENTTVVHDDDLKSPGHKTHLDSNQTLHSTTAYFTENVEENNLPERDTEDTSTSPCLLATAHTHIPSVELRQNDNLSTGESVVAAKVENTGNQQITLCDIDSELREQLEPDDHNKDQYSPLMKKTAHLLDEGPILDVNLPAQESTTTLETVCKRNVLSEIHELIEPHKTLARCGSSSPPAVINIIKDNPESNDVETSSLDYTEALQTAHSRYDDNNPHVSLSSLTTVSHIDSIRRGIRKEEGKNVSVIGCLKTEEGDTASPYHWDSKAAPDSTHTVFAMSSFWREMEKVTINDILGLRMLNRGTQTLHPVHEESDPELFVRQDRCKSSSEDCDELESHHIKSITWKSEPTASDTFEPVVSDSSQKCLRKISKNVSVQNLPALASLSDPCTKGHLQAVQEEIQTISGGFQSNQDEVGGLTSSAGEGYTISLTNIFQYFFGEKPPISSQSTMETTYSTEATSLPETYDLFFSEFDTEHFLFPLMKSDDSKAVPIFSCSRSSTMQFPEVYDSLFASSSSDDSSSEEEDDSIRGPLRVVSRWSHQASQTSTDIYDHFFSDSDVRQNFFWRSGLSFRNLRVRGSSAEKRMSLSSVSASVKSRTILAPNILGNGYVHPEPLLHFEHRINSQLTKPFRYEKLQISNPRLDAPLLALRHSDMCLICIAFASWVLKTANPHVGDTWKAVLLANVSALSAIRYLRKYVNVETRDTDKKLHVTESSESLCL